MYRGAVAAVSVRRRRTALMATQLTPRAGSSFHFSDRLGTALAVPSAPIALTSRTAVNDEENKQLMDRLLKRAKELARSVDRTLREFLGDDEDPPSSASPEDPLTIRFA